MRGTPPQTPPKRGSAAVKSEETDFVAMFDQLILKESRGVDREIEEKLDRFYVETGPYNPDTIKVLKAGGFRWEPAVKHWWAPEKTLRLKATFIDRWPEYRLTARDRENLREAVREGQSNSSTPYKSSISYPSTPQSAPREQRSGRYDLRERPSPNSSGSPGSSAEQGSAAKKSRSFPWIS
jgi:hypothetical protein